MENGIGYSGLKLHNDDREPVWGRSESDSAAKASDSTKTMTAVQEVIINFVSLLRLSSFF